MILESTINCCKLDLHMFRLTFLFFWCFLIGLQVQAQREVKDSLISLLKAGVEGEKRVDVLSVLAYQYYDFDDSLASTYASQALAEATKINYARGIKYAYTLVGMGYASKS